MDGELLPYVRCFRASSKKDANVKVGFIAYEKGDENGTEG